ncbi:MAG: UDP-N-acetylmuramate dehydrogenase [Candidatus Azotimanducaceae bacterium WSBS_2022_MAG_OTU7]
MKIHQNTSLADKNTLRLDARAQWYCEVFTLEELLEAAEFALAHKLHVTSLGDGSNIVLADNLSGLVIKNRLSGVRHDAEVVHASAGENWHQLVRSTVSSGLFGLENLALIPGTVGAAPVQNIGAYGVELDDRFFSLKAIHLPTLEQITFKKRECEFAYRDSLFKKNDEWMITEVGLVLSRTCAGISTYPGIVTYIEEHGLETSGESIFTAVSHIRARKLPDPLVIPNVGSFFKNPVVEPELAQSIAKEFPDVVQYAVAGGKKLSAAWLIDQLGLKGYQVGQFAVSDKHALVIINKGNGKQRALFELVGVVQQKVQDTFGIDLEIEPRIYPDGFVMSYGEA